MNDREQFANRGQHALAIRLIFGVRMLDQKPHVANQMAQAELHQHVLVEPHVFVIAAEVIAAEHAVKLQAQRRDQHLAAARRIDLEQREERRESTTSTSPGRFLCGPSRRR